MADHDAAQFLAALAGSGDGGSRSESPKEADYRGIIDEAVAATESLDAATAFLVDEDLAALAEAVERAERDVSQRAECGRAALDSLRALPAAAEADRQFQSGLRTSLGGGDQADCR